MALNLISPCLLLVFRTTKPNTAHCYIYIYIGQKFSDSWGVIVSHLLK